MNVAIRWMTYSLILRVGRHPTTDVRATSIGKEG